MPRPLVAMLDPRGAASLIGAFTEIGTEIARVATASELWDLARTRSVDVLLVDLQTAVVVPDFVRRASRICPGATLVLTQSEENDAATLEAIRAGAFDVVVEPLPRRAALRLAVRCLEQHRILEEAARLRSDLQHRYGYRLLVGRSAAMERLRDTIGLLARGRDPVLFWGEAGAGKETAARALHATSDRTDLPFVLIDAAGRTRDVLALELFGRRSGDGGSLARPGSVYVDEIGALAWEVQERLARSLKEETVDSGGESATAPVRARLLAGTTTRLDRAVEDGRVHPELASVLTSTVVVPPLRERPDDVPLLARHFLDSICDVNDLPPIAIEPDALGALESYSWPGNVRELRNAIEHAAIVNPGGVVRSADLPERLHSIPEGTGPGGAPVGGRLFRDAKRDVVDAFETRYLRELLRDHGGNVTSAAAGAGMLRSALQRLLRKHGLRSSSFRSSSESVPRDGSA